MFPTQLAHNLPSLHQALEPALIVSSETSILDVIEKMSQAKGKSCEIVCDILESHLPQLETIANSCVLVVDDDKLAGIFTERDLVRLATLEVDLANITVATQMSSPVITLEQTEDQSLFEGLALLRQHRIRHLPMLSPEGEILGLVTSDSIRRVLQPFNLLKHRQVEEIMTDAVIRVSPSTSVFAIAQKMHQHQVSCVIVTDEVYPVGILTERDLVQFKTLDLNLRQMVVQQVMSSPLFCVRPSTPLLVAHQEMQDKRIRRLVVTGEQGELVGILTQTDILNVFDPTELYGVVEVLHQTVESRTAELQEALKKQQDLIELKSRFLSMASHDLRNPLSLILLSADMIEIFSQQGDPRKLSDYLNQIRRASRHMNHLLNDLLLLGQVEAGKLTLQPTSVDLASFCQELVEEIGNLATRPQIQLSVVGTPHLMNLDPKLLRQILTNLLSNAVKYSPTTEVIDLRLIYQPEAVSLEIQDYGIGIPQPEQEKLFESFFRASNVGATEGTGLGLAIVKRCLDLLQGTINVVSQPGEGTTFQVMLPSSEASA